MAQSFANSLMNPQAWLDEEGRLREPDQEGPAGKAWLLRPSDPRASLGVWLVNRPGAHPWWEWWTVDILHLREEDGLSAPKKAYPEAQYEFQIRTIDPDDFPTPDPDLIDEGYEFLEPPDVVEQFHGIDDAQAQALCARAIRSILKGDISPDQDFRAKWNTLIGKMVEELSSDRHLFN